MFLARLVHPLDVQAHWSRIARAIMATQGQMGRSALHALLVNTRTEAGRACARTVWRENTPYRQLLCALCVRITHFQPLSRRPHWTHARAAHNFRCPRKAVRICMIASVLLEGTSWAPSAWRAAVAIPRSPCTARIALPVCHVRGKKIKTCMPALEFSKKTHANPQTSDTPTSTS